MFNLTPRKKSENAGRGSLVRQTQHPLNRLRQEFDTLFDQFFGGRPTAFFGGWEQPGWGLDLEDSDKKVIVRAEAPGFEAEDFDIQVSGDLLTIRAERKQEAKGKKDEYRYVERSLNRSLTLPPGTQADNVEAHYRNGILELRLPKAAEAQGRRISVKT